MATSILSAFSIYSNSVTSCDEPKECLQEAEIQRKRERDQYLDFMIQLQTSITFILNADKSEYTETLYKDLQFIIQNFEVLSCFFFKEYYRFQQRNRVFAHILNKK